MVQKANVIIHNKGIREGFSCGTFLVDSTSLQSFFLEEWQSVLLLSSIWSKQLVPTLTGSCAPADVYLTKN